MIWLAFIFGMVASPILYTIYQTIKLLIIYFRINRRIKKLDKKIKELKEREGKQYEKVKTRK